MPSESDRARRPALDRETIVSAARAAIAKEGLDKFSLRRLASQLGVTAPASVTSLSINAAGVTSKTGFQTSIAWGSW